MRERRSYLGYTICQSLFSSRWIIRLGRTHIGSAPSAFDAVELVEQLVDAKAIDMMLRQGEPLVADSPSRRQERYDAINSAEDARSTTVPRHHQMKWDLTRRTRREPLLMQTLARRQKSMRFSITRRLLL